MTPDPFALLVTHIARRAQQAEDDAAACMTKRLEYTGPKRAMWKNRAMKQEYVARVLRELIA